MRRTEDVDLWCRIADIDPAIGFVDEPVLVYDWTNPASITHREDPTAENLRVFVRKHVGPMPGPRAGRTPKQAYFESLMRQWARRWIVVGWRPALDWLLREYGGWLPWRLRLAARVALAVPEGVHAAAVRAGRRAREWRRGKGLGFRV